MKRNLSIFTITLALGLFLCGCTKEKAEAIKSVAEQFSCEAQAALAEIKMLFRQGYSQPVEGQEKVTARMVKDFADTEPFTSNNLNFMLTEDVTGNAQSNIQDIEFDKLEARYNAFGAMFKSLPEGSYLGAKAVKRAETNAIHLTLDFINFADLISKKPFPFTARRVALLENIQRDKLVKDEAERANLLGRDAEAAYQLQQDEAQAKQHAIVACLKAAEASRTVAELIRNYDKLSASDILIMARGVLAFAAEVSGGNVNVKGLLDKYAGVENTIRTDPYWSAVLDQPINDKP